MFTNKALKQLIIPLVIEQVLLMLVGIADTMMVSYAGEAAISGVSLVDMINNLIIFVLAAVATGGAVIVSQYIGHKDHERANLASSQLIMIAAIISFLIMVLCLVFARPLLHLLFGSITTDVMEAAVLYFVISALSFPFLGIYNASSALYRSMRKTNVTMYVSLFMNVLNIIGNAIGIFVFHAGVAGVAIPTLISRAVAGILMSWLATRKTNEVFVVVKEVFSWHKEIVARILRIAIPNGIENGLFHFGKVLVTSIIALFGTSHIAANGIANSIDQIAIIVVNGVNLAIVTVVGQCVGANDYTQAKMYIKKLMKISYIATGLLNVIVFVSLPFLFNLYTMSDEVEYLVYILVIMHNLLAFALHPTSFVLANGIRAAGDAKFTMYAGIFSMLVFRLGGAALFGIVFNLGVIGVWIAMGLDWLCRSIFFLYRFHGDKWKLHRAI